MKKIYPVLECFDKSVTEFACFDEKQNAEELINKLNVQGSMSGFSLGRPRIVYTSLLDYEENNPEALRNRALSKLTKQEREALGLQSL